MLLLKQGTVVIYVVITAVSLRLYFQQISSQQHSCPSILSHTLTGNSGKILDTNGAVVFEIAATLMTISEHRTLKDASGNKIGQARKKKTPGLHMTYYLGPMDDEKKCAVKAKG